LAGRPLDPLLRPPVFPVGIVELTLVSLGGIEMGWKYNKALITLCIAIAYHWQDTMKMTL
jgi:hypothetical protein